MRPTTPGAINGGLMSRSKETPSPVITIGVDSVEEALKKVEAEGGTVITPSTPIPGMGAFGYFKDSEGNVMGLVPVHLSRSFGPVARPGGRGGSSRGLRRAARPAPDRPATS